jgi:hypothetical protein
MGIRAIALDDKNVQHLIIGLNREDIEGLLRGHMLKLATELTEDREIVLMFAETNDELGERIPPRLKPV